MAKETLFCLKFNHQTKKEKIFSEKDCNFAEIKFVN